MTAATEAPPEETSEQQEEPALIEGHALFQYSDYVHVGEGAAECEGRDDGSCQEPEHFHAWVRLPNPYQHREISDKARAAQARKRRQLKDSETDGFAILEGELAELRDGPTMVPVIEALVAKDWAEDYMQAMKDVLETEEFKTVQHDQTRMKEIDALPEAERPNDEYVELGKHITAYREALDKQVEKIREPARARYQEQSPDELIESLREQRIDGLATEDFLHVYGAWEIVVGAYKTTRDPVKKRHFERHFIHVDDLREESPETIDALKEALDALRVSHQRASTGNP